MQDTETSSAKPHWLQIVLIGRRPEATLVRIGVLVALSVVTFPFVVLPIRVDGISMEPTYHDRQVDGILRLAYWRHEPQRGDVVAIRYSTTGTFDPPSAVLLKRIIALPGETVAFHEGHAYVNGQLLAEPYVKNPCDWEHAPSSAGPTSIMSWATTVPWPLKIIPRAGRAAADHWKSAVMKIASRLLSAKRARGAMLLALDDILSQPGESGARKSHQARRHHHHQTR